MERLKRILAWAQKNERHLGAVLFVFGFVTDLFTFATLSVSLVNLAFLVYLTLAVISTLGSHLFSGAREHATLWRRALSVIFPLIAQYAIGSLLSGCLIFYTKSSSVFISWPFLLLLVAVFIGNEYFRTYYKHLAFQVILLFFAIYAYAIFALPLVLHKLGPWIFVSSTVASLVLLAGFLYLLSRIPRPGFKRSFRYVLGGAGIIVLLINTFYFTGLIPPIPLSLPSAGIYYSVRKEATKYVLTVETDRSWWDAHTQVIHHVAGTPLFAFTSIAAPFKFAAAITHKWEHYDPATHQWVLRNKFTFPISGGRDGGYRGYSAVQDPEPGKWRVTIETPTGQIIGRLNFSVVDVTAAPLIKEVIK